MPSRQNWFCKWLFGTWNREQSLLRIIEIQAVALSLSKGGTLTGATVTLDDLLTDAEGETTVVNSVVTLLGSLSLQLANAGTDQAKLLQLKNTIDSNRNAIAAAIVANTPASQTSDSPGVAGGSDSPPADDSGDGSPQ